jgi:Lrp/AsnC family transcriptional regulator for asnA, asnC and gidA
MQGVEIDERDLRILELLEDNARMPWRRLAKMLGVSEATVYLRIRRLESLGILRGFTARIDPSRLGLRSVMFVFLKVEPGRLEEVREEIKKLPYVVEAYEVSGDYQVLAKIAAPTQREAAYALEALAGIEGVRDYTSIVSLETIREDARYTRIYKFWASARGQ